MSTTSDASSSYCGDLTMDDAGAQFAMSAVGIFYPPPKANVDCSPLRDGGSYRSINDVVYAYEQLLKEQWCQMFGDKAPAPSLSTRLDFLWMGFAEELFSFLSKSVNFHWQLVLCSEIVTSTGSRERVTLPFGYDSLANDCSRHVTSFLEKVKVRFRCNNCHHNWTSKQGWVEFWLATVNETSGVAFFRLFNQKCQKCTNETNVLWYPTETIRVLIILYEFVARQFHKISDNQIRSPIFRGVAANRGAGGARSSSHHPRHLCEACQAGRCQSNHPRQLSSSSTTTTTTQQHRQNLS